MWGCDKVCIQKEGIHLNVVYSLFTGIPYSREKVIYTHANRNVRAQKCVCKNL